MNSIIYCPVATHNILKNVCITIFFYTNNGKITVNSLRQRCLIFPIIYETFQYAIWIQNCAKIIYCFTIRSGQFLSCILNKFYLSSLICRKKSMLLLFHDNPIIYRTFTHSSLPQKKFRLRTIPARFQWRCNFFVYFIRTHSRIMYRNYI